MMENWINSGIIFINDIIDDQGNISEVVILQNLVYLRERPFNLKGGGRGLWFFSKKNIPIPNVAEKNILILVVEKKNNLIQSFCHIT